MTFSPTVDVHWNNETPPSVIWLDVPERWEAERQLIKLPQAASPESKESRHTDLELRSSPSVSGSHVVTGSVLYYVCEESGGQCLFLRQPLQIKVLLAD